MRNDEEWRGQTKYNAKSPLLLFSYFISSNMMKMIKMNKRIKMTKISCKKEFSIKKI